MSEIKYKSYHKVSNKKRFKIDEQTRKDLELNDLFNKYNRTLTSHGESLFYHYLNSQPEDIADAESIKRSIKVFRDDKTKADYFKKYFKILGKQYRGNVIDDLWNGFSYTPRFFNLIPFWFFLTPLIIYLAIFLPPNIRIIIILILFTTNIVIFNLSNKKIGPLVSSVNYLIRTVSVVRILDKKFKPDEFTPYKNSIMTFSKVIKYNKFIRESTCSNPAMDIISILFDYLRVFFVIELFSFYHMKKFIEDNIDKMRDIIELVGYYDMVLNCLSIFEEYECCYPEFSNEGLSYSEVKHPLVENCIPQTIDISKGLIITGMNMAGKSTFLKALSINQILATSLGFSFAEEFKTELFYIVTSMKIEDDLEQGKSRYYMEADRLLYVQNLFKERKVMFTIDEILSGTNTSDRIYASIGILKNFTKNENSLILASTHDSEIAFAVDGILPNFHFDGTVTNGSLEYDYKLKKGVVKTKNALTILENIGVLIH